MRRAFEAARGRVARKNKTSRVSVGQFAQPKPYQCTRSTLQYLTHFDCTFYCERIGAQLRSFRLTVNDERRLAARRSGISVPESTD